MARLRRVLSHAALVLATTSAAACAPVRDAARNEIHNEARAVAPSSAATAGAPRAERREVRLLLTTDEHGWLSAYEDKAAQVARGGLVAFAAQLAKEGLGQPNVALFSVGDMWTGPYESTVLEGAPMVAAMNHIGYRAAVIGNHEFDFGLRVLEKRQSEARFPLLAANLRETATGRLPPWAQASVLVDVGGIRFGVVGLTHVDTPSVTDPRHLAGLEFLPYEAVLRAEIPKLRQAGAEQILVLIHDRVYVGNELSSLFRELGVHAVGLGHAHSPSMRIDPGETPDDPSDDVASCNGGAYLRSYCRIDLAFEGNRLVDRAVHVVPVQAPLGEEIAGVDPTLAGIVADAEARADHAGREVLVRAPEALTRESGALGQLVVDSWAEALPYVDVAITNAGGLRQDLPSGDVRVRDVVSVLPFQNYLVVVELTGTQLKEVLENREAVVSGVRFTYRETEAGRLVESLADVEGEPIRPEQRLRVVINDFMYRGGDGFRFKELDPEPEETALDWREPVFRKLRALNAAKRALAVEPDGRATRVE